MKAKLFNFSSGKAPGPDGLTSEFFRKFWPELKATILESVAQFYKGKPLLNVANHTFLTLIPKTSTAMDMVGFRPISCVNMIYKVLTKLLEKRISKVALELISPHQTAFIQGRHISDNTILADEMLHGYGGIRTPKRCCISIVLRKIFDTVKCKAIITTLKAMGFSQKCAKIINNCISTASSVLIKGTPTAPFKNQRGIRQGDTLSPFLLDLIMDVLSRLIKNKVEQGKYDTYQVNGTTKINHLMYADAILLFTKANPKISEMCSKYPR